MVTQVAKKHLRKQILNFKPTQTQIDVAFIVGNGTTRLCINPEKLKEHGTVYGCNAQYREYSPHYLVSVDVKMVNEIVASGYHRNNEVWTNPNKGINAKSGINYFSPHKGWSSGPTAMWFAATNGHKHIYILGFDYVGIKGKLNNVYADTYNYKKSTDSATFHGNWLNQTDRVIKEFPNIQFYRLIQQDGFIPDKLANYRNLHHITYENMAEVFGSTIYSDKTDQKSTI